MFDTAFTYVPTILLQTKKSTHSRNMIENCNDNLLDAFEFLSHDWIAVRHDRNLERRNEGKYMCLNAASSLLLRRNGYYCWKTCGYLGNSLSRKAAFTSTVTCFKPPLDIP